MQGNLTINAGHPGQRRDHLHVGQLDGQHEWQRLQVVVTGLLSETPPAEIRQSALSPAEPSTLMASLAIGKAPFRLSTIHAIELYLTALLLHRGHNPSQIRKMHHDLSARTEHTTAAGLRLRAKTAKHLQSLSQNREYLVTRYGPEMSATASQINRLTATLEEVAVKVTLLIGLSPSIRQANPSRAEEVQVRDMAASLSAAPAS